MGATGEYSDRCEWVVGYTQDEQSANEYLQVLTNKCAEAEEKRKEKDISEWLWYSRHGDNAEGYGMLADLDPNFRHDYTGTTYWVEPVKELNGPQESKDKRK